jgi:hypothetical protein
MKKTRIRKLFAVLLSVMMLFSPLPAVAQAAESQDMPSADPSAQVTEVSDEDGADLTSETAADPNAVDSSSEAPDESGTDTASEAPDEGSTDTASEAPDEGSTDTASEAPDEGSTDTALEAPDEGSTNTASEAPAKDSGADSAVAPTVTAKVETADGSLLPSKGYSYNVDDTATAFKAVTACSDSDGDAVEGGSWSYKWWSDDGDGYGCLVSTTAEYTPSTDRAGTESYYCDATYTLDGKKYEAKTDEVSVAVYATSAEEPDIYEQPTDSTYQTGAKHILPLSVDAWASDGGTLSYQWYESRDNQSFSKIDGGYTDENEIEHYMLAPSSKAAVYYYYCEVTNTQPSIAGSTYTSTIRSNTAKIAFVSVPANTWSGEGTKSSPFLISSAEDLEKLEDLVNKEGMPFEGFYFRFTKDITLPSDWAPIGALKDGKTADTDGGSRQYSATRRGKNILPFSGTIDGGNRTLTVPEGGLPLLGYVRYATVENLKIYGKKIAGYGLVDHYCVDYGPTGDYSDWTESASYPDMPLSIEIDNVTLKSGSETLKSGLIGGYASGANTVIIKDSTVEKGVTIGYDGTQSNIGSFAGYFNGTIENCVSSAAVQGVDSVGGLIGAKGQSMGNCNVWDSAFHGTVKASGEYAGGLLGSGYNDGSYFAGSGPNTPCVTIQNCYADGSVTGTDDVGGLLGGEPSCKQCWANGIGYIQNNYFSGKVSSITKHTSTNAVSGLINIIKAFAGGETDAGEAHVGGIIGNMSSLDRYNVISNNYYLNTCGAADGIGAVNSVAKVTKSQDSAASALCAGSLTGNLTGSILRSYGSSASDGGERYGRSDDPTGTDADSLARAATKEQFTDGSVLSKLNSGVNSSGTWMRSGSGYPKLNSRKKHMVSLAVTDYSDACEGGSALEDLAATASYSDGSKKSLSQSQMCVAGFDSSTEGYDTVTAKYQNHAALFEVRITSDAEDSSSCGQIKVSFRLIGATKSSGAVSLKNGNYNGSKYVTWIPEKSYTLDSGSTVYNLFKEALGDAGLKSAGTGSDYVSAIYAPEKNDGYKLAASANGPRSGWMYTVNGSHPSDSLKDWKLENGDEVIWHYVDDYSYEVEDWFSDSKYPRLGDGTYYNEWLKGTKGTTSSVQDKDTSSTPETAGQSTETASQSTVTTVSAPNGGTVSTVMARPDTPPVVAGDQSEINVTVPSSVTSLISSATAEKPAEITVSAPASAMIVQIGNSAVKTVALTMKVPAAVANNTNANANISICLDSSILQAAKNARKDLTVEVMDAATGKDAYSWTFTGSSLTDSAAGVTQVNLALSVKPAADDPAAAAVTADNTAGKKASGTVLQFGDNGLLPAAPASVRAYVGNQPGCAPSSKVYLYYLDGATKMLEQMPGSECAVDADGYVTVAISHCSEYVLLPQPATDPYPVKSDTTYALNVKSGESYTYAMTVSGKAAPVFSVGNDKAFATSVKRCGNKYYFTVRAVGKAGTMTAVYSTLPKQKPAVLCYLAVA